MTLDSDFPDFSVLGVMTGTSCDALDAACVVFHQEGWEVRWTDSRPFSAELRKRVMELQSSGAQHSLKSLLELNRDLGSWYGSTLESIIQDRKKKNLADLPDVIANHGQTVAHFPKSHVTLQMGDPAQIAWRTGLSVVSHFREGDLCAGGEGAPLVPLFHKMLARKCGLHEEEGISIHNLGGVSNLTYLGPNEKILAFDTGPGNFWIDSAVERVTDGRLKMDLGGDLARRGRADQAVVKKILQNPYFDRLPPKSTGRDEFPFEYFLKIFKSSKESIVATATQVTVDSIVKSYEKFILKKDLPLARIYFCGGGAKNDFLLEQLRTKMPDIQWGDLSRAGFDPTFIEAEAFALFGFMSLMGQSLGGEWTGAQRLGPPGQIVPGRNWHQVVDKVSAFINL